MAPPTSTCRSASTLTTARITDGVELPEMIAHRRRQPGAGAPARLPEAALKAATEAAAPLAASDHRRPAGADAGDRAKLADTGITVEARARCIGLTFAALACRQRRSPVVRAGHGARASCRCTARPSPARMAGRTPNWHRAGRALRRRRRAGALRLRPADRTGARGRRSTNSVRARGQRPALKLQSISRLELDVSAAEVAEAAAWR